MTTCGHFAFACLAGTRSASSEPFHLTRNINSPPVSVAPIILSACKIIKYKKFKDCKYLLMLQFREMVMLMLMKCPILTKTWELFYTKAVFINFLDASEHQILK